ncbi:MAG: hypothetical protein DHS20C16_03400 [Phycisphaerae bacterium]|nr:MAG: hypothetical protein DHS20C16_03400 [Phycisphaerae bacterium]
MDFSTLFENTPHPWDDTFIWEIEQPMYYIMEVDNTPPVKGIWNLVGTYDSIAAAEDEADKLQNEGPNNHYLIGKGEAPTAKDMADATGHKVTV